MLMYYPHFFKDITKLHIKNGEFLLEKTLGIS